MPRIVERKSIASMDIHSQQTACHGIKPRGEHNNVQRIVRLRGLNTSGIYAFNRVMSNVNQLHVVAVEGFKIMAKIALKSKAEAKAPEVDSSFMEEQGTKLTKKISIRRKVAPKEAAK